MGRLPEILRLYRGNLELLFVSFIWGINSIAVKDALGSFLPLQFNAVRLLVSAGLLLAILSRRAKLELPARKDWPAGCGRACF